MSADRRRPTAIDLFAGAGGLSLGLEQAGFDVAAAVEYDPVHAAVHEYNFPNTKTVCRDISKIDADWLRSEAKLNSGNEEVNLVCGGPPCQGFSLIGRRLIDDERNQLVFHFLRIVTGVRPKYFVMENVPGMATGGTASIISQLMREFEDSGYRICEPEREVRARILNAADFGVPQDRRRLFIIGAREDMPDVAYPDPVVSPVSKRGGQKAKELQTLLPQGPSVGDAIRDLPNLNEFTTLLKSDEVPLSRSRLETIRLISSSYSRRLMGIEEDVTDLSVPREWDRKLLTSSTRTVHTERSVRRFMATKQGETEPVSRFYRLDENGLSNTLRAGTGSERGAFTSARPIHPTLPRVISVREAARLHSFPDWFRLHETKWHGFRQIGNAVAPMIGRAIGQAVVSALEVEPQKPESTVAMGDTSLLRLKMGEAVNHFNARPDQVPKGRTRKVDVRNELAEAA